MPAVDQYYPPGTPGRRNLQLEVDKERRHRKEKYERAKRYLAGQHRDQLNNKPEEPDDNTVINVIRQTVDREVSFLFPSFPHLELEPDEIDDTPDEKWLMKAWEENGGLAFLHELAQVGALAGHNHVRVLPPRSDNSMPRLVILNPAHVVSFWKIDDIKQVVWHEIAWSMGGINTIIDVVFDENLNEWFVFEYQQRGGTPWELVERDEWPSEFGPVVQWKHLPNPHEFYGKGSAEAEDIRLQDAINLIFSEMMRINRYHASPRTIAIGVHADDILPASIDDMWAIENPDVDIKNLEMVSQLSAAFELANFLYETYLTQQRVVIIRGEVKDFQRVTNSGVKTVFMDNIAKRTILAVLYGMAITNISHRMSVAAGRTPELAPVVKHAEPLPLDEKEQVDINSIELASNVISHEEVMLKRGRNPKETLERMRREAEDPIFINGGSEGDLDPNPIPEPGQ